MQNAGNRAHVAACAYCGRTRLEAQFDLLAAHYGDAAAAAGWTEGGVGGGTACAFGCGVTYCDAQCRDADAASGHAALCVGPHDETHPLYRFVLLALESGGAYEEFMMAARLSVLASLGSNNHSAAAATTATTTTTTTTTTQITPTAASTASVVASPYEQERTAQATAIWHQASLDGSPLPPWWDLVSPDMEEEDQDAWRESARSLVEEAWELLVEGTTTEGGGGGGLDGRGDMALRRVRHSFFKEHDAHQFSRLLTFVAREKVSLLVPTALEAHLLAMAELARSSTVTSSGGAATAALSATTMAFAKVARARAQQLLDEELAELRFAREDDPGFEDIDPTTDAALAPLARAAADPDDARVMRMVLAEPHVRLAPRLAVLAIPAQAVVSSAKHSCVPSHKFVVATRERAVDAARFGERAGAEKTPSGMTAGRCGGGPLMLGVEETKIRSSNGKTAQDAVQGTAGSPSALPATFARIDVSDLFLEERTEQLALRGIPKCRCLRCVYERWWQRQHPQMEDSSDDGGKEDDDGEEEASHDVIAVSAAAAPEPVPLSLEELRLIAHAAQQDQRYDDARAILSTILDQCGGNDGDALYARARMEGWDDNWAESRRLLVEAGKLCPEHPEIQNALSEAAKYDGASSSATVDGEDEGRQAGASVSANAVGQERSLFGGRAHVCEGVLTAEECAQTIADVEAHVADTRGGEWTTARHYAVPTTDVPVHECPKVLDTFNAVCRRKIFPMLARQFHVNTADIRVIDAFVVKYDAARGQRSLPLHCDQSQFSLTVSLNDAYEGGGTYFAEYGEVLDAPAGGIISFEGNLLHGGHRISAGIRYIVVAFLFAEGESGEK